jgi:serine protease Do
MTDSTMIDAGYPSQQPIPASSSDRSCRRSFTTIAAILVAVVAGVALVAAGMMWSGRVTIDLVPAATSELLTVPAVTSVAVSSDGGEGATAATATTGLVDVSDIAADVVDSVVTINVTIDVRGPGDITGSGSGIIVDGDGTIVTNAHVVDGVSTVTVTLTGEATHAAAVVGIDTIHDLAVLAIDADGLSPITLGTTDGLEVGNPVVAVGNPFGLEGGPSVTTGIVSALGRVLEDSDVSLHGIIQTDAAITECSSGGALLDGEGRLIGVTTAVGVSSVGIEGIGFAIPVETVSSVVAALLTD